MKATKKLKNGWVEGSVQNFLGLTDADMEYIEMRLALSHLFKARRQKYNLTQEQVASQLHTSQSRVAKMENGDPTVSLDLLLKALFHLGLKRKELVAAV